jgi:hypothetical protein
LDLVLVPVEDRLDVTLVDVAGGCVLVVGDVALAAVAMEPSPISVRGGGPLRQDFERITKRRGKKIAKVAVAREILTLCYYGLRDGEIRCLARRCRPGANAAMAASP